MILCSTPIFQLIIYNNSYYASTIVITKKLTDLYNFDKEAVVVATSKRKADLI